MQMQDRHATRAPGSAPARMTLALARRLGMRPQAETEKPQYGGTLEIGTVYVTLSALSLDPARLELEAQPRHRPVLRAAVRRRPRPRARARRQASPSSPTPGCRPTPSAASWPRSWEWKREPAARRDQAAQGRDVPREARRHEEARAHRRGRRLHLQPPDNEPQEASRATSTTSTSVEAPDKHTVVFDMKQFNAEWDYRFGWGYYSAIKPKEVVDAGATNWKNVNGTGPVHADRLRLRATPTPTPRTPTTGTRRRSAAGIQAAVRRQDHLSHHQGRGDLHHRAAHRQARHPGDDPLAERRRAEEERAAAASGTRWLEPVRHLHGDAHRPEAVRRRPRAPRAQHGGQQGGDRQGLLQRQRRAVRLSAASRLRRLLRAARQACRPRCRSCSSTIRPRPRSCWPRRAIPRASPSRCRSARAIPTTWTCCRWSRPTSSRSA